MNQSVDLTKNNNRKILPEHEMFLKFKEKGTLEGSKFNIGKRIIVADQDPNVIIKYGEKKQLPSI